MSKSKKKKQPKIKTLFKLEIGKQKKVIQALVPFDQPLEDVYRVEWLDKGLQSDDGFWVAPWLDLTEDQKALYKYLLGIPNKKTNEGYHFKNQKGLFVTIILPDEYRIVDGIEIPSDPNGECAGIFMLNIEKSMVNTIERVVQAFINIVDDLPERAINDTTRLLDQKLIPGVQELLGNLRRFEELQSSINNYSITTELEPVNQILLPHGAYNEKDFKPFKFKNEWDVLANANFPLFRNSLNQKKTSANVVSELLEMTFVQDLKILNTEMKNIPLKPTNFPRHFLYQSLVDIFHSTASLWLQVNPVSSKTFKTKRNNFVYAVIECIKEWPIEDPIFWDDFPTRENIPSFGKGADIPKPLQDLMK